MNLQNYLSRQLVWSLKTFGEGKRTEGILKHIEKEIAEVRAAPNSYQRMAELGDIAILALDGMWRQGFSAKEICDYLQSKQDLNRTRVYPFPESEDEPSEH